jgi:AraC-like DNA-binding protein
MDGNQQQALERAAAETFLRLDEDLEELPPERRAVLAAIRARLFDQRYRPPRLSGKTKAAARAFYRDFGEAPESYLRGARLETAMRLLRDSGLDVGAVALLVGYADVPAFRQAFRTWFGLGPRDFREHARRISEHPGWPEDEILSVRLWQRAAAGDGAAVERLRQWLRTLYPEAEEPVREPSPDERFWRRLAERLWAKLAERPHAELLQVFRSELRFGHPALVRLLAEKSRRAEDPRRARELAELARAALDGSAEELGDDLPDLRAAVHEQLAAVR